MYKSLFILLLISFLYSTNSVGHSKSDDQSKSVYEPKSVQDTYSRDFEYFYKKLKNEMVESSQTPENIELKQKQENKMSQKIDKVIELLKQIKQMNQKVILQASKKKKFSCDERFGFRWNRDMSLAIDCNWRYNFPVCGFDYSDRKRQTFKNECIACFIHRTIKSFTYGKC